jgi:hypothetical protein
MRNLSRHCPLAPWGYVLLFTELVFVSQKLDLFEVSERRGLKARVI